MPRVHFWEIWATGSNGAMQTSVQAATDEYNPAIPMTVVPVTPTRLARAAWLLACALLLPAGANAQALAGPGGFSEQPAACTNAELVSSGVVTGRSLEGFPRRVQDGALALEGTAWNDGMAVQIPAGGRLMIDLRGMHALQHFAVQGDDNDNYVVEGSEDGVNYRVVWTAPPATTGQGLRTRWASLPKPEVVRYLRVYGAAGDGFYSVSELRAYCASPKPWPPQLVVPPELKFSDMLRDPVAGWRWIDNDRMVMLKGWAAAIGTLILLGLLLIPIAWRKTRIVLDTGLVLSGLFAFAAWWNLGHFHFDHYEHIWEHYHYYVGAKYGPELRFARLYECTAAADMSDGLKARVVKRNMRDLAHTNELGSTDAIVANPERCTKHFTPARWEEFRKDIRFFRGRFSRERWDESQGDHGYNGTPVWGLLGRALADNFGELTWEKIQKIAYIDSALLVIMWLGTWWAFGWRATAVALLYWGYNFPARFYWNGGSMLRYDWIFWLVIGICMLKKKWHFAGGAALTYATLLRVFPGFVVAAIVLKVLARMVRLRRFTLSREHTMFAAGALVTLGTLIPASSWATGGLDAWGEFAQNSKKHLATALTNNMGLKTAMGFDYPTSAKRMRNNSLKDPFREWKEARHYYYSKRGPIMFGVLVLFCIMLARAGDREPDWVAACLGAGLIAMASELTCYYYGFLLTYGLLWERRKLPGILATALAAVTCLLSLLIDWNDEHFAAMSLATTIVIVITTFQSAFMRAVPDEDTADQAAPPQRPQSTPSASAGGGSGGSGTGSDELIPLTSMRVQDSNRGL